VASQTIAAAFGFLFIPSGVVAKTRHKTPFAFAPPAGRLKTKSGGYLVHGPKTIKGAKNMPGEWLCQSQWKGGADSAAKNRFSREKGVTITRESITITGQFRMVLPAVPAEQALSGGGQEVHFAGAGLV
jgi:hypothetical protein